MVSALDLALAAHRTRIRSIDRSSLATIEAAYQDILDRLAPLIELTQQQALADGVVTPAELFRLERYQELQRQAAEELERLARLTGNVTAQAQAQAVLAELDDARDIATATARGGAAQASVTAGWVHLPTSAVEDLVGMTQNGPLADLLRSFGDDGARFIADQLVQGLALGQSPRTVADAITKGMEISRNRALTIARTEMLRSARGASQRTYAANDDVLNGWYWLCAHSERTCAACLAMDGTFHELTESLESHVSCRCAMRPGLRDIPMTHPQTGAEWLAEQPPETQDAILGKQGGEAYRNGEVALQDFVRREDDPVWGASVRDGGIGWARGQAGRRVSVEVTRDDGIRPFASLDEAEAWAGRFSSWSRKLTDDERKSAKYYQGNGFKDLNPALRTGKIEGTKKFQGEDTAPMRDHRDNLDSLIAKSELDRGIVVYRGSTTDWIGDIDRLPGTIFEDKGYTSTSLNPAQAKRFNKFAAPGKETALFEISVPRGARAAFMDKAKDPDALAWEYEMLLPRGTRYRITETVTNDDGVTVIRAEVIE